MQVKTSLFAILLSLPLVAQAENFSYRNIDLAFFPSAEIDTNGGDVDGSGLQLRGSIPVFDNFFAIAEFESLDLDFDVDVTRFMVGGGGHWPINNKADVIVRAGVVNYQVDVGNFDDDDTGLFIGARIRGVITPQLELEGGVEHNMVEVAGIDNDTYLIGEARYLFTRQWSAGVLLTLGGDTNVFGVQARLNF